MTDHVSHGTLTVTIADDRIDITLDESTFVLDVGPRSLTEKEFGRLDPPPPACLTNALGAVHDALSEVLITDPVLAAAANVRFAGHHARALASVEIGDDIVPDAYCAQRAQLDEVFRTLVAETANDRLDNPGLDESHVDTIIATCCVVLAIMRRLELREAFFDNEHAADLSKGH